MGTVQASQSLVITITAWCLLTLYNAFTACLTILNIAAQPDMAP